MSGQTAGGLRVLRGLTVTVVAVMLAAAGHVAGGGHRPTVAALVLTAALSAAVATVTSPRALGRPTRWSPRWGFAAVLAIGQVIGHVAFSALTAAEVDVVGGHVHGVAGSLDLAAAAPVADLSPGWVMLAAHVIATLVAAAVLAGGEAAFVAAADRLASRLPAQAVLLRPRVALAAVVAWLPILPGTDDLGRANGVRGPPLTLPT